MADSLEWADLLSDIAASAAQSGQQRERDAPAEHVDGAADAPAESVDRAAAMADDWQDMLQGLMKQEGPEQGPELELAHDSPVVDQDKAAIVLHERMYGAPTMLRSLGTPMHRRVAERFLAVVPSWTRGRARAPLSVSSVLQEVVRNPRMASRASLSASAQVPEQTLKESLLQMACSLLYSSTLLIGAFICGWMSLFRAGRFAPIAVISRFTYDETPLKLRLQEHRTAFQAESSPASDLRGLVKTGEETYVHSKILNVEWRFGPSEATQVWP